MLRIGLQRHVWIRRGTTVLDIGSLFWREPELWKKGANVIGAAIGCIAGIALMKTLALTYLSILVAVLFGVLLARSSLLERLLQPKKPQVSYGVHSRRCCRHYFTSVSGV